MPSMSSFRRELRRLPKSTSTIGSSTRLSAPRRRLRAMPTALKAPLMLRREGSPDLLPTGTIP
jgi:hypothetical protein